MQSEKSPWTSRPQSPSSPVELPGAAAPPPSAATAKRLLRLGAKVVLADLPRIDGNDLAASLGDNARFAPTDVTSESDVQAAVAMAYDTFGSLNLVVNGPGAETTMMVSPPVPNDR